MMDPKLVSIYGQIANVTLDDASRNGYVPGIGRDAP